MCGIAGIVDEGSQRAASMASVRRMIDLQRHRGPDGAGFYDTVGASLGHCRLAIIDLSDTGQQPMSDPEGRYWITFNGEIYNHLELAEELLSFGYRFKGRSDTEVLLIAYRHWGEACLQRLRGMFAFAIWDENERSLFAARDRLGIKPFHYWYDKQRFTFASELKALLEFLPERRPNLKLAREFLAWNLLDHNATETMVEGIYRLPPAHSLTWTPTKGLDLRCYWVLDAINEDLETPPQQRAKLTEEFRSRFEESVSLHLRSDVPVGTCLSGGLDSSSIVCVVSSELRRRGAWREDWQHTFSACFDDPGLDERPYIKSVADATGCRTHYVFPSGDLLREELDTWLWHQDEPVGSTSAYAQYCVARLAREHGIKVLLDGQGADEQLAGYRKFILVYLRQLVDAGFYVRAVKEAFAFCSSPEILRTSSFVDGRRYFFNSPAEVDSLWPGSFKPERPPALFLGRSLSDRLRADLTMFSLPLLLRYEDRNTMAFGVESRVPFVDHLFVEWLATLPADLRLAGGWTKWILRNALIDVLPERVRMRKTKLGFSTPESEWLAGPLAGWLTETLESPRHLFDIVDQSGVRKLHARRNAGDRSLALESLMFRLATYESWARRFLKSDTSSSKVQHSSVCH